VGMKLEWEKLAATAMRSIASRGREAKKERELDAERLRTVLDQFDSVGARCPEASGAAAELIRAARHSQDTVEEEEDPAGEPVRPVKPKA
jgi:hypothetical protein